MCLCEVVCKKNVGVLRVGIDTEISRYISVIGSGVRCLPNTIPLFVTSPIYWVIGSGRAAKKILYYVHMCCQNPAVQSVSAGLVRARVRCACAREGVHVRRLRPAMPPVLRLTYGGQRPCHRRHDWVYSFHGHAMTAPQADV